MRNTAFRPPLRHLNATFVRHQSASSCPYRYEALVGAHLGRTGIKDQQTQQKADHSKPNNLYEPVEGDHGAHGRFDDRAYKHSPQLWTNLHREWILGGVLTGILAVVGAFFAANRSKSR